MIDTNTGAWAGFSKNTEAVPAPKVGAYLAYLLPNDERMVEYGEFGAYMKFEYNVFVPSKNGTVRYVRDELVTLPSGQPTEQDKLVQRILHVNGLTSAEGIDLSTLPSEGYIILHFVPDRNTGIFLRVARSEPIPRGYSIPADVVNDPTTKPMSKFGEPGF